MTLGWDKLLGLLECISLQFQILIGKLLLFLTLLQVFAPVRSVRFHFLRLPSRLNLSLFTFVLLLFILFLITLSLILHFVR